MSRAPPAPRPAEVVRPTSTTHPLPPFSHQMESANDAAVDAVSADAADSEFLLSSMLATLTKWKAAKVGAH